MSHEFFKNFVDYFPDPVHSINNDRSLIAQSIHKLSPLGRGTVLLFFVLAISRDCENNAKDGQLDKNLGDSNIKISDSI